MKRSRVLGGGLRCREEAWGAEKRSGVMEKE